RLSSFFDLHTDPSGTAVLSRITAGERNRPGSISRVGAVVLPVDGEPVSGDAWAYSAKGDRATFMIVDGLGHGRAAHEAAKVAIAIFQEHSHEPASDVLHLAHLASRGTRGA